MGRLNRQLVIAAAVKLLEEAGEGALTIPALAARLKIRPPSLYNHIESLSDLKREIAILAHQKLTEQVRKAAFAKSREEAVFAMANAFRRFASEHPGLYRLSVSVPPRSDRKWTRAFMEFREIWVSVFESYRLGAASRVAAARMLRAFVHGFVDLELSGGWLDQHDIEGSFRHAVRLALAGIELDERAPKQGKSRRSAAP